jgi:hypothetical protein
LGCLQRGNQEGAVNGRRGEHGAWSRLRTEDG